MQAVMLEDVGKLSVETIKTPTCAANEILIKVEACAICATDVKVFRHGHRLIVPPRVTGHELAGTIIEIGKDVEGYSDGQRVTVAPAVPCGNCFYCRNGEQSLCGNPTAIGYHYDGGFAEFMIVPALAIENDCVNVLPDNVSFEEAALTEPLAAILHCQEVSKVSLGDTVVVIGAGPLGCIQAWVARSHGASTIIMVDISAARLKMSEIAEADFYIDASKEDATQRVMEITGRGAEVVIVACSAGKAQEDAMSMVAPQGNVNFFGSLPKGNSNITIDGNIIHYKECYVSGSQGSAPRHNKLALELISKGTIPTGKLITHRLPLSEYLEGIKITEAGSGLKVMILPTKG
jgi:L-iditol 2-dehydrogenase